MRNAFLHMQKKKMQISFTVITKLITALGFATRTVHCLYFINQKFQASSNLAVQSDLCQTWSETPKSCFLLGAAHIVSGSY